MKRTVFQVPVFALLCGLLLALPCAAAQEGEAEEVVWTFVHGATQQYGALDLDRIGEVYLQGKKWQKVAAVDVDLSAIDGPLFVVGNLDDNLIAQALTLPEIGSAREYLDRPLVGGVGFVFGGRRSNGKPFCVFTGLNDAGVYQCFTTNVNVAAVSDFVIQDGKILINWGCPGVEQDAESMAEQLVARRPLVHNPASMALRILDPQSNLVQRGLSRAERAELAARVMAGYGDERQLIDRVDWLPAIEASRRRLLGLQRKTGTRLDEVLSWTRDKNLARMAEQVYRDLEDQFGFGRRPAPAVFLLLDSPQVTNARTVGVDVTTGRPRVVFNLACFPTEKSFRIALVHEYLHCLQLDEAGTLPDDPLLVEGVAVFLTQIVVPDSTAAEVLMWSEQDFEQAEFHAERGATEYREQLEEGRDRNRWFTLGESVRVSGRSKEEAWFRLPDRMGYYLGYQAARGWKLANEESRLADMLRLQAGALLDFMPDKFRLLESGR